MWNMVVIAVVLMAVIGVILGLLIGVIAKFFKVPTDSRVELVTELLPGANCGGCGTAGCADFAKAVVAGKLPPSRCPVSSKEQISAIARALGIADDDNKGFEMRAIVACGGDDQQTVRHLHYNGVVDCRTASLVAGGPKGCQYGCIGLGTCANKCPFGAIEIVNNLALVHQELCVGCGKCVDACPRGVIKLVPRQATVHVYCNSPAKGIEKRKNCKAACIGCRKCARYAEDKFGVEGFLAHVKYDAANLPDAADLEAIGCPTGALLTVAQHQEIEQNEHLKVANE